MKGPNNLRATTQRTVRTAVMVVSALLCGLASADDSILINNPSFEANMFGIAQGHANQNGDITGWTTENQVGLNPVYTPEGTKSLMNDTGHLLDGAQVAFLQTNDAYEYAEISQVVSGLEVGKRYWLQVAANRRSQIHSTQTAGSPKLSLSFDDELIKVENIEAPIPSKYEFTASFVAKNPSGRVTIRSERRSDALPDDRDRTLIVDAVSLIQRDLEEIRIFNPSFEARGAFGPVEGPIAGWATSGNRVDVVYARDLPDGINAARLQASSSLSRLLGGFVPGAVYELRYNYALPEDSACGLVANIGEQLVPLTGHFSDDASFHQRTLLFRATSDVHTLSFETASPCSSIMLDNISVREASTQTVNWLTAETVEAITTSHKSRWSAEPTRAAIHLTPNIEDNTLEECEFAYSAITPKFWLSSLAGASIHFDLKYDQQQIPSGQDKLEVVLATSRGRTLKVYDFKPADGDRVAQILGFGYPVQIDKSLEELAESQDFEITLEELEEPMELRFRLDDCDGVYSLGPLTISNLVIDGAADRRFGDIDGNGSLDANDINAISQALRNGSASLEFDIDGDGLVHDNDRTAWVHDVRKTYLGDANLDGFFDTGDLVSVLSAGKYEDLIPLNADWETGDWNGDGDFTTGDLVDALSDGGYERGPRAVAVPESGTGLPAFVAMSALLIRRKREIIS